MKTSRLLAIRTIFLSIGEDSGRPVAGDFQAPSKFNGEIETVIIEIKPGS